MSRDLVALGLTLESVWEGLRGVAVLMQFYSKRSEVAA